MVGIVETLTQNVRSTTVMAVRDTELAKLPEGLLNAIKLKFPMVVSRLINLLGHRILGKTNKYILTLTKKKNSKNGLVSGSWQTPSLNHAIQQQPSSQSNFSTVAVLPVSDDVPLSQFSHELFTSLSWIGMKLFVCQFLKKSLNIISMQVLRFY